jgi:HPt (histidine-containing phosphotransfer) domain-containing protein
MIGFVHRLAGTAGTIGFDVLSERAGAIESAFRSISDGGPLPAGLPNDVSAFFEMIADLAAESGQSEESQP